MSKLLDVYENMIKEAEAEQVKKAALEALEKYAGVADALLKEEYGKDYKESDVEELAEGLMDRDIGLLEEQEKVATYDEIGRELAHAFAETLKEEGAEE